MSVVFESIIKMDKDGSWYIELRDSVDNRVAICKDIAEYSEKVEDFGSDYGGNIDEVKWLKDENVPPYAMDEIRMEMAKQKADIEEEKGESLSTSN